MMSNFGAPSINRVAAAAPVFDPRYNNLIITLTHLLPGNLPSSHTLTLTIRNGEGEAWLDPAVTPTSGMITRGKLVLASESFPRFAPLTLTLTGADLSFLVRQSQVLNFSLVDGAQTMLRLLCSGLWTAAHSYRLTWPAPPYQNPYLILTRINAADGNRETPLIINVLKGSIAGLPGGFRKVGTTDVVSNDRVQVLRANDGELTLQLHGARMEWDFANGVMVRLRVFESRGPIANLMLPDLSGAGVSVSVAFAGMLP
jgi:hypothetical protein